MYLMRTILFLIIALSFIYCVLVGVTIHSAITKLEKIQKKENSIALSELALDYNIRLREFQSDEKIYTDYQFIENQNKYYTLLTIFQTKIRNDLIISLVILTAVIMFFLTLIFFIILSKSVTPVENIIQSIHSYVSNGVIEPLTPHKGNKKNNLLAADFNRLLLDLDTLRKIEKTEIAYQTTRTNAKMLIHEIKNKLSPVHLIVGTLLKFGDDTKKNDYRVILNNLSSIENIMSSFKDLANLPPPVFEKVTIHSLLEELKNSFSTMGDVLIDVAIHNIVVLTDRKILEIICTNLIKNAFEAGALRVTISYDADKYSIIFGDNGPGVNEDCINSIFNPGFTTKKSGDGMGLFIVKHLSNMLGYTIEYSHQGFILGIKTTTFNQ
ncbi:MAG: hypothetical protein A2015_06245 [Spirochaetes bacterium GWF1_31_7]|nr:MAG: hypothetical protein A2Y30_08070 [Spirochaetes bacterium GWE1_32_154]OHD51348.1 MAG: hypothetical protein A2Y29_14460 [Spirochaetes bacterium GWE2_31_10]OHD53074.1 MAG: hypothetical protein A2015_06245 [Spirochaetes bacterium GWF1_31_7]OHD74445.1 MAG: hypothetical protein A2355_15635 [Spirochaetes bacterium RIFOXYB1_FULL_32_8]